MRPNFKQASVKLKCNDCNSENVKKRKNYSHGNSSKGKISYYCGECRSTNVEKEQPRFQRRR